MNKRMGKAVCLVAGVMLIVPVGCQQVQEHRKTAIGAGVGAAGGAVIGGLSGGKKGAIIGGLLGALAGGAVGAYLEYQDKSPEETNRTHNYNPSEGTRLEIDNAAAQPAAVAAGGQVNLQATYAVMAPDANQAISVNERRVVTLNGQTVADTQVNADRKPGTYTSTVPITLPGTAAAGTYTYKVTVSGGGKSAERTATFTVGGAAPG